MVLCKIVLELGECDLDVLSLTRDNFKIEWSQNELLYILIKVTECLLPMRYLKYCHLDIKP